MKIIGIIAEYNPFHNGHAYQIKKIKKELQADYVIVAMSGDFVQRGAPAIVDKYARTQMALSCGADLVIELPVLWATASAEYFAMAGVTLLDKLGCVDGICFGAETDDLNTLSIIADVLIKEPDSYRLSLSDYLKEGLTFPMARSKALCEYLSMISNDAFIREYSSETFDFNTISELLNTPNNILAIEYLKALKRRKSHMTPYVIKRKGAGYHDETIASASNHYTLNDSYAPIASATGIRKILDNKNCAVLSEIPEELLSSMPVPALEVLTSYSSSRAFLHTTDFSSILGYQLLTSAANILSDIGDSNSELANRFSKNRMNFSSFEQFCEQNKSKDITYTRIRRILLHLILNIRNQDYSFGKDLDYIPYLRLLGFRKDSSVILKKLKDFSIVPIISKLANASTILDADAFTILEKDIFAADLYSQICAYKKGNIAQSEYTRNIIIL